MCGLHLPSPSQSSGGQSAAQRADPSAPFAELRDSRRLRADPSSAPTGEPSTILEAARTAALEAGRRVMELLRSPLETARKADHSIVTNADHEANTIICGGLRRLFPKFGLLSEESGLEGPAQPEDLWVIDPIDGTRAFANGFPGFSVMVGLLREGKPAGRGGLRSPGRSRSSKRNRARGFFGGSDAAGSAARLETYGLVGHARHHVEGVSEKHATDFE